MRIGLVTDWFSPRRGGIEAQLGELATRLRRAGHEVGVITGTPGPEQREPYKICRLGLLTLPDPPLVISPRLPAALRAALRRWDVVHAHVSVASPVAWVGAMVARSHGTPVAVTFHSILRQKAGVLRAIAALTRLQRARVAWSAVSGTVARQAAWGLGADVRVLPNGMDLQGWRNSEPGQPSDALTLVSTMRLHRKKRGAALLRAFADATRGGGDAVTLLIAGDGPERARLSREIARLGLGGAGARVELLGWRAPAELRALYARADGFVQASVHEAFGIAALEARASGLPVVARRSGTVEFLEHGENALLADDDEGLASLLRRFVADAALRERLAAARTDLARFDWSAVVAEHEREYDRAIRLAAGQGEAGAASA